MKCHNCGEMYQVSPFVEDGGHTCESKRPPTITETINRAMELLENINKRLEAIEKKYTYTY